MEEAIEIAASKLKKKLEKAHTKHTHCNSDTVRRKANLSKTNSDDCSSCKLKKEELESGKKSPIVMSPTTSAKSQRRQGVSARNPMEGKLVRETMKIAILAQNIDGKSI